MLTVWFLRETFPPKAKRGPKSANCVVVGRKVSPRRKLEVSIADRVVVACKVTPHRKNGRPHLLIVWLLGGKVPLNRKREAKSANSAVI